MEKHTRIINYTTLEKICNTKEEFNGVILGHENCPHFYRQLDIDKMIQISIDSGLDIRVNIPVLFEEYLQEFENEAERLINKYPDIKIIVNDWGILAYLHERYPEAKFTAGKGISFTYGDNPWNEHILLAEKEEYREILKAHNMENPDTITALKELGVDEIELSDLEMSYQAYKNLKSNGFKLLVNKNMSVVTMSRACHCLRFLDKHSEMGNCINYCTEKIVLSIQQFFDMANMELKEISKETKDMQPDMIVNGNLVMVKNSLTATEFENIDILVYDERIEMV